MAFELTSSAFKSGDPIPRRYTCEGEDLSPPFHWTVPPAATKSFVMIADDPDAPVGTWVHWVIYDLPLDLRGLAENVPAKDRLPDGALQGLNDFKRVGYGGPCPPPGKPLSENDSSFCAGTPIASLAVFGLGLPSPLAKRSRTSPNSCRPP
jgi:Raf kinase inhibitor-like YbhB/YbcL family protein